MNTPIKTVFLTGASGYIGGSVAAQLVRRGVRVRGLVRGQDKASYLAAHGIEPIIGDLDDVSLLTREASQSDAVINTASADHAGSILALVEALSGTSKVLLHTSGSSIVGDNALGNYCAETIFDEETKLVVQELKQPRRDIDLMVLGAAAREVRSMVICPSLIYGQGRGLNPNSVQIPFLAANAQQQGVVQIVGPGRNVWSNVHIDDVVDLYLAALDKAPPGSFFFAANGETSFAEIGEAIARRLQLPGVESLDPAIAAERWGVARAHYSLGSNSRVRSTHARAKLGWKPRHASVVDWILNELPMQESI